MEEAQEDKMKNKNLILFAIILLIFNISFVFASPFYYNVSLYYNKGVIKVNSIDVIVSNRNIESDYGDYKIEQIEANKKTISSNDFMVPNIVAVDYGDENGTITGGEIIELDEINFEIFIPYNEKTKELVIYDKDKKELTRANIGIFSKDAIISDLLSEKEIEKIKEETTSKPKKTAIEIIIDYWWVLIILLLIIIVVLLKYPALKGK